MYFIVNDLFYFIDWNITTLNGRSIIMTFLFDWIASLFIGFVLIISSLVILYSDDYMFGDLNITLFVSLVSTFVVSSAILTAIPIVPRFTFIVYTSNIMVKINFILLKVTSVT